MEGAGPVGLVMITSGRCPGRDRALTVLADFRRAAPEIPVTVVDIDQQPPPENVVVVGTPMYVLRARGRHSVVSLGNPLVGQLLAAFGRHG